MDTKTDTKTTPYTTPRIGEIAALLRSLKAQIGDDYRASDDSEDTTPGMQVTIGASPDGGWSYQTGDNSYTGGAYGHAHWGVTSLYRRSNTLALAREIVGEIGESMHSAMEDERFTPTSA